MMTTTTTATTMKMTDSIGLFMKTMNNYSHIFLLFNDSNIYYAYMLY